MVDEKKAEWLGISEIFNDHRQEIQDFVDCYLLFSGLAGKCSRCQVKDICLCINVDNGHQAPEGDEIYDPYGWLDAPHEEPKGLGIGNSGDEVRECGE